MAQRRNPGSGRVVTDRGFPPIPYSGATGGQQARMQNLPITGERHPPQPPQPYKEIVDYLVDSVGRRMVEEFSNQKMPTYQPPWVVPPFEYRSIHQTTGCGTPGAVFVPDQLAPVSGWVVISTINVPKGFFGTIDKLGFDLTDNAGGPANVPYQCTLYRIMENGNHVILPQNFGAYGTVQDPYKQYICHVYPNRPVTLEFNNTHPLITVNVQTRMGGWQYRVDQYTGKNGSVGIVD